MGDPLAPAWRNAFPKKNADGEGDEAYRGQKNARPHPFRGAVAVGPGWEIGQWDRNRREQRPPTAHEHPDADSRSDHQSFKHAARRHSAWLCVIDEPPSAHGRHATAHRLIVLVAHSDGSERRPGA